MAHPERGFADTELSQSALILAGRFVQRWDRYARQLPNGLYVSVNEPLTVAQLYAHLRGEITLGTYLLDSTNQARFLVLDADVEEPFRQLKTLAGSLEAEGAGSYLETSRRGGHLWLFLRQPQPGRYVRQFGQGLLQAHGITDIELYPKQANLTTGPGSLIRMPFGIHQVTGKRYGFITAQGQPIASTIRAQIKTLASPQIVPPLVFEHYRGMASAEANQADFEPLEGLTDTVSGKIKAAIPVLDFIEQYVDLKPTATGAVGRCPFHEDQHPSFGVNGENNFWYCFAGCGGGSIIDFWMKWRKCDFKTAIKELAGMLL